MNYLFSTYLVAMTFIFPVVTQATILEASEDIAVPAGHSRTVVTPANRGFTKPAMACAIAVGPANYSRKIAKGARFQVLSVGEFEHKNLSSEEVIETFEIRMGFKLGRGDGPLAAPEEVAKRISETFGMAVPTSLFSVVLKLQSEKSKSDYEMKCIYDRDFNEEDLMGMLDTDGKLKPAKDI